MWWRLHEQPKKKILYGRAHEVSEVALPGRKARDKMKGEIYNRSLQKHGNPRN